MKTNTQPSKADQVKGLRERRSEAKGRVAAALGRPLTKAAKPDKAAAGPKAAKAKARAPDCASSLHRRKLGFEI